METLETMSQVDFFYYTQYIMKADRLGQVGVGASPSFQVHVVEI